MDISPLIDRIRGQFKEIEGNLSDPVIIGDREKFVELSREHQRLSELLRLWDELEDARSQFADNQEMLQDEADEEFRAVIQDDVTKLETTIARLEKQVMVLILPPGENDSRNTIVEIRPAAGGDEAALFGGDLYRMYCRFAESRGWKMELLNITETDLGGIKEVEFCLQGDNVFRTLQYEGGVHRVQRIPTTETGGRIHTSTVTVALMPEATEVDIQISPEELEIVTCRASGPGGQSVNTTDSAVQITHLPTGISVKSKEEKSQHKNKAKAMRILRSRLLEKKQAEEEEKMAAERRSQVGTGDRSERIRTYNFPQNRVTDHRFNLSWYSLPQMLEGQIQSMLDDISAYVSQKRLEDEVNG